MQRRDKLRCTWTFWQDQWGIDSASGEKKQSLSHLGDADNVKDFYVFLNRHGIATVPVNASLHIFRKHVRPEWEDKHNIDGGHLRVFANIQKGETPEMTSKRLSCLWFDVLRSIIGEHFKHADQVVGVGYTHKLHRPIMSVWLSSTDPDVTASIRSDVFELFSVSGSAMFTARFYSHKGLAKNETGVIHEEVHWHRRIQSAPERSFVSVGDEEEGGSVSSDSDESSMSEQVKGPASPFTSQDHSPIKRAKDGKQVKKTDAEALGSPEKESPTTLLARRGMTLSNANIVREHLRSRTETSAPEAITSQPIRPPATDAQQQQQQALHHEESGSGIHVPSIAPTPIKDWTTDWSPSAFTAAQSQRSGNFAASRAAAATNNFSATVTSLPPKSHQVAAAPRAIGVSPDVASSQRSTLTTAPQPQHQAPLPVAPSPSIAASTAKPVIVDPNQLSDRKPFVYHGIAYPPRMNRKDYRAIIFNQTEMLIPYEGSFAAPGAPDGDLSIEAFEAMKTEYLLRPLDVN